MKKSWIVLVALFVVVIAVAAQVAAQDSGTALSGTVRVGSWESGDALKPWNNAIASFEAANPGVDVQLDRCAGQAGHVIAGVERSHRTERTVSECDLV